MTRTIIQLSALLMLLGSAACHEKSGLAEELSPEAARQADSLSRLSQKKRADSLKEKNPLLILPPDSSYTGEYIDKYATGIVKYRGFFRFGRRHGQWMSFYPNGARWSEMHYDKGLREGPNMAYFENGKMRYEGFYRNDKQDSIWNFFDSTGAIAARVQYRADKIIRRLPLK